jgi:hypothetical protein
LYAKFIIAASLSVGLLGCSSAPRQLTVDRDIAAVKQVVEQFRVAILNKDKTTYLGLFFSSKPDEIGWQAVVDDAGLEARKRSRPQAVKARRISTNNFVALIDSVVASKTTEEEKISNVSVDTDGEIASASFDYVYQTDGKATNWGREQWQLVRTEQGWKIFSVVYTIRDPAP